MYEDESKAGLALMPSRSWSGSRTRITLTTLSTMSQRSVNKVRAALRRKHYSTTYTRKLCGKLKTLLFLAPYASLYHCTYDPMWEDLFFMLPLLRNWVPGRGGTWPYSSLYPQGLVPNLAQGRCSINVHCMRKLLAGIAVSWHSRQSDRH